MRAITIDPARIRAWFRVLFTPLCWVQNYSYSKVWDHELRRLLSEHTFTDIGPYTAKLGHVTIWIENHPYASMRPYRCGVKARPSRATILRAHDMLIRDMVAAGDGSERAWIP